MESLEGNNALQAQPNAPPQPNAKDSRRLSLGSILGKPSKAPVFGGARSSKATKTLNPLAQSQDRGLLFNFQPSAEEGQDERKGNAISMPTVPEHAQASDCAGKMPQKEGSSWQGADKEQQDTHRGGEDQQRGAQGLQCDQQVQQNWASSMMGGVAGHEEGAEEVHRCWSTRSSFHSTELLCSPAALQQHQPVPSSSPTHPAAVAPLTREQSFEDARHSFDRYCMSTEPPSPQSVSKREAAAAAQAQQQGSPEPEAKKQKQALPEAQMPQMQEQAESAAPDACVNSEQSSQATTITAKEENSKGVAEDLMEQMPAHVQLQLVEEDAQTAPAQSVTPENATSSNIVDALSQLRMYDATPPPAAAVKAEVNAEIGSKKEPAAEASPVDPIAQSTMAGKATPNDDEQQQQQLVKDGPAGDDAGDAMDVEMATAKQQCEGKEEAARIEEQPRAEGAIAEEQAVEKEQLAAAEKGEQAVVNTEEGQLAAVSKEVQQPMAEVERLPAVENEAETEAQLLEAEEGEREQPASDAAANQPAPEVDMVEPASTLTPEAAASQVHKEQGAATPLEVALEAAGAGTPSVARGAEDGAGEIVPKPAEGDCAAKPCVPVEHEVAGVTAPAKPTQVEKEGEESAAAATCDEVHEGNTVGSEAAEEAGVPAVAEDKLEQPTEAAAKEQAVVSAPLPASTDATAADQGQVEEQAPAEPATTGQVAPMGAGCDLGAAEGEQTIEERVEEPAAVAPADEAAGTEQAAAAATPVQEEVQPAATQATPQPTEPIADVDGATQAQGHEDSMDRGSSMDAATAARLAHELGVALAMESYAGSFKSSQVAETPAPQRAHCAERDQLSSGTRHHTVPFAPANTRAPPATATKGPSADKSSVARSELSRLATPHAGQLPQQQHYEQLGLLDMEMEDVGMAEQYPQGGEAEGEETGGAMPPLEATPSPGATSPAGPSLGSHHAQMQVGRDSIPLFVRDSYAVSDSVSLDRQSLNGLEPFGRSTSHHAPAAPLTPTNASTPLDTLHEEASFMEDLPPKSMAELQRPSQTPGTMQRSAVRAARAATAAGFDDHDINELPDDLPDPMMISPPPAPAPVPRAQGEHTAPHARPHFTSPIKPPLPATPAHVNVSARKQAQPPCLAATPSAAAATDARARMGLPAHTPTGHGAATTTWLGGAPSAAATPTGAGRVAPRGGWSSSGSHQGVHSNAAAPSPRLSRGGGGGPADPSVMSLSAQKLGKTPSSARRTQLSGPGAFGSSAAGPAPGSASRTLPKCSSTPSSHAKQQPGPHVGPSMRSPSPPFTHTPGPAAGTPHGRMGAYAAATPPAATPAGQGHVPTAVMPTLAASLNTPMATMQRLPMEMAVNAPLLDRGSPLSEMDFGMDTTNIAEEAKRLMQSLAGPGGSQNGSSTFASNNKAAHTPEGAGKGHPVSQMQGTPPDFKFSSLAASQQVTPMTLRAPAASTQPCASAGSAGKAVIGGTPQQCFGLEGSDISPGQAGFLETQNRMLMERLVGAEERAQAAEREVEQLRDQIKTINFGDMLQENGAGDMEHEARLYAEEQLQVSKAEVSGMQEAVRNMQQALTDTKATNSSQSAELKELRATNAKDKQQLNQLLGQVAHLEAELATEREQSRKMSGELNITRQRLAEAEALSEARGAEVSRLTRQRDEAQGSLKHSTEELIAEQLRSKQQIAEATKQASAMQASLTKLQADKDALKRDAGTVYNRMKASESQAAAHKGDVQRLKQENGELVRMAEELMCSLEKERQKNRASGKS